MILSKIRGIFAFIQFVITVFIIIIFMYLFNKRNHIIRKYWAKLQIFIMGIRFKIIGDLDENAELLLINHQSLLDIIVLEYLHNKNIAWVAKKELENIPFFGNIIKLPKMISIDRENKTGLIKLIKEVKDRLDNNRPIAMFPEGTRGEGDKLLKFKSGAKIVANKYNLRVQPIVLINTKKILDSKSLTGNSGEIKVIYLDTVTATKDSDWFKDVENQMNEVFNKERLDDN